MYDGVKGVSNPEQGVFEEIDYKKFKLFQLSMLWRAGVSSLDFFSDVSLGPHEERVRKMLLDRNPGKPYEYGCIINLSLSKKYGSIDLVSRPGTQMIDGHRSYWFHLCGGFWIFIVSKHSKEYVNRQLFLSEQGRMVILNTDPEEIPFYKKLAKDLRELGRPDKNIRAK